MRDFELSLMALRSGMIDFPAFVAETRAVWGRFARYLARRWRPPSGVEIADLEQEVLLSGWEAVRRWDPARGVPIDQYVTFQALDRAKKWLHTQRKALRRDDSAPSRAPMSFSSMGLEDAADVEWLMGQQHERVDGWSPSADARVEHRDRATALRAAFAQAKRGLDYRDREALAAVEDAGGDLDAAVAVILADPGLCLAMRVGGPDAAENMVRAAVRRAAASIGETEHGGVTT